MADAATVDLWNLASAAARHLSTHGVSPNMLHAMQNISVTMGQILFSSIQDSNSSAGRVGEKHGLCGHFLCATTSMDIPTIPQHGCKGRENLPNGSCCCTDCESLAVHFDERREDLEIAHFMGLQVSSDVPGSPHMQNPSSSLYQCPSVLEPSASSRQACTETQWKSRLRNSSGPYASGQRHCSSTVVGARPAEGVEADAICGLCFQKPAASNLGYRECWECFFGMHR